MIKQYVPPQFMNDHMVCYVVEKEGVAIELL